MACMSSIIRAIVVTPNIESIDEISLYGCQVQVSPFFKNYNQDLSSSYMFWKVRIEEECFILVCPSQKIIHLKVSIFKSFLLLLIKGPTFFTTEPIWHPNIDLQNGQIILPIEWSPVLKLHSIVFALQLLFLEPSDEAIVNFEAGRLLLSNPTLFDQTCQTVLHGGMIGGILYPNYILRGYSCWCKEQIPFLKQQHSNSPVKCDIQNLTISSTHIVDFCKKRCHSDFDDCEDEKYSNLIDGENYRYHISQTDWNKRRIIDMEISSTDEATAV